MNKVLLVGRTTADIELQTGSGDSAWCRFSLAVDDGRNADGDKLTQFIPCVAWNILADTLHEYVKKGDLVALEGRITNNNYTDKDGVKHYGDQVVISAIQLLPNREKAEKEEKKSAPANTRKYHR